MASVVEMEASEPQKEVVDKTVSIEKLEEEVKDL